MIGLEGKPIEVQIRTHEMHRRAEYGIAAHWGYKEAPTRPERAAPSGTRVAEERRPWRARDGSRVDGRASAGVRSDRRGRQVGRDRRPPTGRAPGSGQGDGLDDGGDGVAAAHRRLAAGDHRPPRVPRDAEARPRAGRGLRLHPQGQGHRPRRGRHADRLRLLHPHRGRPPLHRGQGERPPGPARHAAAVGRHRRDHHLQGALRRALARLAPDRGLPRARNKIRQWFSRERREDAIETGREELDQGAAPRGPARCRSWPSETRSSGWPQP